MPGSSISLRSEKVLITSSMPQAPVDVTGMRARSVILLLRDVRKGVQFYGEGGLGLALKHSSETVAEFETGGTPLILKAAGSEPACSVG